ncbi:hypothetical protein GCM10023084_61680 [Streptomyces lacrimifluminis]|uniref:Uncharacterized protein n=1 Tax=Streptomyces lacrimifluminis TaxID=1500077 RepID=A0A917L4N3_9ACTN|nr:hypothetical protein [Streptomyces lacrimifluminis]GGJ44275.1 hypothetical protein GCM10012282_46520 [Streptomyces lacrimifluminis]
MADDVGGAEPTRVDRVGPSGALLLYFSAVVLGLCGPVMMACTYFAGPGLLPGGVLGTVIGTPLGLGLWFHVQFEREGNRRLDAVGVVATAEVTSLADRDDGESAGLTVGLRISGPGARTFETTWKRSSHPALRVDLRLTAVVDPARNLFRLEF